MFFLNLIQICLLVYLIMLSTPIIPNPDYSRIYEPAEDSFLLLDLFEELTAYFQTKKFSHRTPLVVEIGTGSGIVSTFINQHILPDAIYIATDINPYGCSTSVKTNKYNTRSYNFDSVRCDLASSLLDREIDLLIFNPPYVPAENVPEMPSSKENEDIWVDIALNGGPTGMDVTNRILEHLNQILSIDGEAYILFCARNRPAEVVENFLKRNKNYEVEKMIFRKAGWEELSIYKFVRLL